MHVAAVFLIAFAIAFFAYSVMDTLNNPVFGIDFVPYHLAGRLLAEGDIHSLTNYTESGGFTADRGIFLEYFHRYFFPESTYANRWIYLPAYVWIFRPLASLDFHSAVRVWLAFNSLVCVASVMLLWAARRQACPLASLGTWRFAWYLFIGLTFQPVISNLMHGQVTGLIFFGFCLGYWLLRCGKPFSAGLAFGIITPFKFYPAFVLLYFVFHRRWRVVAGAVAGWIALAVVSLATVGWSGNLSYARFILNELNKGAMAAFNNQSLLGFLLHVFTRGDVNTWHDMSVPQWLIIIRLCLILLILAAVVWVMRRPTSDRSTDVRTEDIDLSLMVMVMLLISPITWYHYYMWVLLPLFVLFDQFMTMRKLKRLHVVWLAVAYALMVVEGIFVIRPFAAQSLQNILWLRIMLSQSLIGAVFLTALIWDLRRRLYNKGTQHLIKEGSPAIS